MEQQTSNDSKLTCNDSEIDVTADCQILKKALLGEIGPVKESPTCEKKVFSSNEGRKGRPKAELLNTLILQGSTSSSSIKCKYCGRVFPRKKSLKVHVRTHTGERPYVCDYPLCSRKFAQSGQLKTHQIMHSGERRFICAATNCSRRFSYAHRRCPDHPDLALSNLVITESDVSQNYDEVENAEVRKWLQNWKSQN